MVSMLQFPSPLIFVLSLSCKYWLSIVNSSHFVSFRLSISLFVLTAPGSLGLYAQDSFEPPHLQGASEVICRPQPPVLQQGPQLGAIQCGIMWHHMTSCQVSFRFSGPSGVSHAQDQGHSHKAVSLSCRIDGGCWDFLIVLFLCLCLSHSLILSVSVSVSVSVSLSLSLSETLRMLDRQKIVLSNNHNTPNFKSYPWVIRCLALSNLMR